MSTIIGTPGGEQRWRATLNRYGLPVAAMSIILGVAFVYMLQRSLRQVTFSLVMLLACMAIPKWREPFVEFWREWRDYRAELGAQGEERVGAVLAQLPETYIVFADYVPLRSNGEPAGGNNDFVIVGPSGVTMIEVKNTSRTRIDLLDDPFWERDRKQVNKHKKMMRWRLRKASGGTEQREGEIGWNQMNAILCYAREGIVFCAGERETTRILGDNYKPAIVTSENLLEEVRLRESETVLTQETVYRVARVLWGTLPDRQQLAFSDAWRLFAVAYAARPTE